ncbi:11-beta-hydroxysteroid dehydrogenase-like 5 [Tripterygium wilfordii]|uniref:11-beta-hydroxysteroid dehydrogenase-like 5 n=1 Tax=Tripterygium wilfordii TaxID=458696 RepID=A0A7J7CXK9_TRIWF|nr:11-beta-hydroxysteroid dehydrogenase B-like [Tripterygium wilfordii]KAF5738845.1 11-beta-hydroxysteroid dehydrogenase-like 5 [Tripterygium wilfordii]
MDLMNSLLNLVVPPASMVMMACAWPGLTFIRTCEWIYGYFNTENMEDKVVIITGASSGIGEQIAYEYAKRKAKLVLVARRDQRLRVISENARLMGANHVMIVAADVVKEDDCRRFVTETINYYGSVDHLVLTTSLGHTFYFEEVTDTSVFPHILDINFWGNVYPTLAALPYLHQSNGRIIVNASVENWLPLPRMSLYASAKAALINFFESLRFELSDEVGITIATHGWVGMEMTRGRLMLEEGAEMQWKEEREVHVSGGPVEDYARMIVTGACRGEAYVRFSSWHDIFLLYRTFAPNLLNWTLRLLIAQNGTRRTSLVGTGRPLLEGASPTKLLVSPASPYSPQHSQQQKME